MSHRRQDQPTVLEDLLSRGFDRSHRIERDDNGRFCKGVHVRCSQCEALVINGTACHETGCPHTPREEEDTDDYNDNDNNEVWSVV
jgi:hypothetical protein